MIRLTQIQGSKGEIGEKVIVYVNPDHIIKAWSTSGDVTKVILNWPGGDGYEVMHVLEKIGGTAGAPCQTFVFEVDE